MITVENVTKRYGEKVAVDDLTFEVKPGIVTGFLGPNGAGKSTTMRLILGLDAPSAGSATIDDRSYQDLPAPLHEVGRCSRHARFTPAARPTTTCSRWPRSTEFIARACRK